MYELHKQEQYFFDDATIKHLTDFLSAYESVCVLCAPLLGRSLSNIKSDVTVLDIDDRFADTKGYLNWNIYKPQWINQSFDIIVCDPPFFNVSLSQLFKAIRMLSHNSFDQKLMIGYLSRRSQALIGSFHLFNLLPTGYYPSYVTVQKTEKNEIEFLGNLSAIELEALHSNK
jgi:Probable N6-adenine methyltransferase